MPDFPRASKFRKPPAKVYFILNTVIGLSHLCFHSVLYFLNNPSVIFSTQLHSISEYCRILNTPHHLHLYWNWLSTLPSSSSREGGEMGGTSQVEYPRASLYLNPALLLIRFVFLTWEFHGEAFDLVFLIGGIRHTKPYRILLLYHVWRS